MNNHQAGLRFLPPPFHHPGWRGHPTHVFRPPKIRSSCLYASRCKEQESSCLEFEAEKFSPAPQTEVPLLPGLETKDPAFSVRQSGPPQPTFATSSLQPSPLTIYPPPSPRQELTSAAPKRNLHACSPSSSPSDFPEKKRDYEVSLLLKPNYGSGESKGEEEEEEKEEHFLRKSPSLDLSRCERTSPGNQDCQALSLGVDIRMTAPVVLQKEQITKNLPQQEVLVRKPLLNDGEPGRWRCEGV